MNHKIVFVASALLAASVSVFAEGIVAVFPAHGVNTDKSFVDAFGMLLAAKYRKLSGLDVLPPTKTSNAIGTENDLNSAARQLNSIEYIETEAVGLYLSRKEKAEVEGPDGKTIIVKIEREDDDDDDDNDDDDQELLDNHKTIVTVTRRSTSTGERIHSVEMTLVTYGDIEESTDRIAQALFKKVTVEQVIGLNNVTRREGMGHNKMSVDKLKGVKLGYIYPVAKDVHLVNIITIGYNQRFDSEKFFLEMGAGGRIPTDLYASEKRKYGGAYMHVGGGYYFIRSILGVHGGLGVSPHINFFSSDGIALGLVPFVQAGVSFPRNSRLQGMFNFKLGQNVIGIKTGNDPDNYYYGDDESEPVVKQSFPTEIGVEFGLGF
jgi:hypothetical protein